jgi:hypothetical protein
MSLERTPFHFDGNGFELTRHTKRLDVERVTASKFQPGLLELCRPARVSVSSLTKVEHLMPAKSKAQQEAAGAALAAKRGDQKKSELRGASKSMAKSMSKQELKKMASSKRKGKPERAE